MFFSSHRVMEPESMETLEEVRAYDALTLKYLNILHSGFVETIVNLSPPNGTFLEVGCGTGWISIGVAARARGVRIVAVDLSRNMLTVAEENAEREGVAESIAFQFGDAKALPFKTHRFDAVYCHNMLHHIVDPLTLVQEMNRVAKPEGALLIRDLIRVSPLWIPFHVHILGLPYNKLMKKEYRDSIKAALSRKEWTQLLERSRIEAARNARFFVTHQGIERPAKKRRASRVEVPTPLWIKPLKKLYVSPLVSMTTSD